MDGHVLITGQHLCFGGKYWGLCKSFWKPLSNAVLDTILNVKTKLVDPLGKGFSWVSREQRHVDGGVRNGKAFGVHMISGRTAYGSPRII